MSRHCFDTSHKGFPITVVLGWDRPMQYFFLTIEKPEELIDDTMKFEDDRFLYSNLHEVDPFGHGLDYYREVLRYFQIIVPESMFIEVEDDAKRDVGNRVARHQPDGSFTEPAF
ncbi:TPA: hypothetical protein G8N70_003072 [Salmonella enterica]|uniref:Uncharacterized protein n=1 Tax=Salmonella enterica TaxID=28901 RepID=A0A744CCY6_SALER|nr:hypothetical protein [Salmonella enterica]HAF4919927.1 hypothetical protein [Salmonella enterica]